MQAPFLPGLIPPPSTPLVEREARAERAAILEFDAGLSRAEAERRAGLSRGGVPAAPCRPRRGDARNIGGKPTTAWNALRTWRWGPASDDSEAGIDIDPPARDIRLRTTA